MGWHTEGNNSDTNKMTTQLEVFNWWQFTYIEIHYSESRRIRTLELMVNYLSENLQYKLCLSS